MNDTSSAKPMTELTPNVPGPYANAINVGRNDPDGWTSFNGNIGDVFLYKTALTDAERDTLQTAIAAKFGIEVPTFVAITGKVPLADGSPIANAVIQVGDGGPTAITGADGKYVVTGITAAPGVSFYADALGYADHNENIDTSAAANGVITKADVVLTPKPENDYTYIQNGGFENGLFGWGKDGTPVIGVTTTEVASGGSSGYWQSTEANWYAGYLRQRIPVVEGSSYNIYFILKTTASVGQCGFDFLNEAGDSIAWWGYAGGLRPGENWMYTTVPKRVGAGVGLSQLG